MGFKGWLRARLGVDEAVNARVIQGLMATGAVLNAINEEASALDTRVSRALGELRQHAEHNMSDYLADELEAYEEILDGWVDLNEEGEEFDWDEEAEEYGGR